MGRCGAGAGEFHGEPCMKNFKPTLLEVRQALVDAGIFIERMKRLVKAPR